jgi:flavin reductase (DIM6/NTAB) family NADH-FMN oxidoreductase RutF
MATDGHGFNGAWSAESVAHAVGEARPEERNDFPAAMDPRTLRDVFGRFATGVTVVTCATDEGVPHGATVTAFTPVSLHPALVQVALSRTTRACSLLRGRPFAVNVLAHHQVGLAMHFGGRPGPDPVRWRDDAAVPILADVAATFSCRSWRDDDGGDHVLFLGEVTVIAVTEQAPLIFHGSAFHRLGLADADATWFGSADDPHAGWFDASSRFLDAPSATPSWLDPTTPKEL